MEKIDYEKLSESDKNYLRLEFIRIFEKVLFKVKQIKVGYMNYLGPNRNVNNLKVSGFGKILLLAKKVLVNTAITKFTGIEPVYLDNDTSFMRLNVDQRRKYYKECDMNFLCSNVIVDMENGVTKLIDSLSNAKDKKIDEYIYKIIENYNLMQDRMVVRIDDKNLDFLVYPILYNLKMINIDEYNRYIAMRERKMGTGMNINILKEINDVYLSLNKETKKTK